MAETEIKILITAVDEASKKLDTINKNVDKLAVNAEKQTKSLSNSFDKATGNLLVLGNAAARVDSIFDSYDNMLLRIENSQTRVYEAQKNVRDAQYNLNKVMQDGKSTAEDVAKAQDDLETSSNRLNMSQNNLQRTMNSVTGTYIQMGISIVTLMSSLPALLSMLSSTLALINPIALGIVGLGATITAGVYLWNNYDEKIDSTTYSMRNARQETISLTSSVKELNTELRMQLTNSNDIAEWLKGSGYKIVNGQMVFPENERQNEFVKQYSDSLFKVKVSTENLNVNQLKLVVLQDEYTGKLQELQKLVDSGVTAGVEYNRALYEVAMASQNLADAQNEMAGNLSRAQEALLGKYSGGAIVNWGDVSVSKKSSSSYANVRAALNQGSAFNDFISRPGQGVSTFSPNDTIVGVKDTSKLGGITVNIGNVYGLDANMIAESLQRKLRSAIIV